MRTLARRGGPLTLRVGTRDLTLAAGEANAIVEASEAFSGRPSEGAVGSLAELLAVAPTRVSDPLELDQAQLGLLREVVAALLESGGGELSPAIRSLDEALASCLGRPRRA
ncbi:MAG TPA: hypothetical protein VFB42_05260 [Gaiellaceae bacterium]|nr:hypothetical protein [Gaiellaceae bacterium]